MENLDWKKIDETRNYFIEEIDQNKLTCKKQKKIWTALTSIVHLLILASAVTGFAWISSFASLLDIPIVIMTSAVGLKVFTRTVGVKKYKLIIKKKEKAW